MKQRRLYGLLIFLFLTGELLFSQSMVPPQRVLLAYFEDESGDFRIVSNDGSDEKYSDDLSFGDLIPIGWTIVTSDSDSAELTIEPSGSIIKISENTNFSIDSLQNLEGADQSSFTLGFGKFRAVAGKLTGNERYEFKGQSATCGVRGTDFGMQRQIIDFKEVEEVFVFKGEVEYTNNETKEAISVKAGEFADALAPVFKPEPMPEEKVVDLLEKLEFKALDVKAVPQAPPEPEPTVDEPTVEEPQDVEVPDEEAEPAAEPLSTGFGLSFAVGAITIGDETYAKAVVSPLIQIGDFKMALYLPFIYSKNLLDPLDWYRPKGNHEWSFGTDRGPDPVDILRDIAIDLALKIKYIQWGEQRDPFYLKVGNLDNFTIGHGIIMRNYANNPDFPAIRRLGFNIGLDFSTFGFEAIVNDLTEPEIFGGRVYMRPAAEVFPMAIGFSGIVDIKPAGDLLPGTIEAIGDPLLINMGLDVELPIIESDLVSFILFGDIGGLLPYYRAGGMGAFSGIEEGPSWATFFSLYPTMAFKNYGMLAGMMGNVGPVSWRVEFRHSTGTFVPGIMSTLYERQRGNYAVSAAAFSADPSNPDYAHATMGLYGEAGYVLENIFYAEAGYLLPFYTTVDGLAWEEKDFLHLEFGLYQGFIPGFNFGVSLAYDRDYFIPMLIYGKKRDGTHLALFDEYAAATTRIVFGPSEQVDLTLLLKATALRDGSGRVQFHDDGRTKLATTLSIETQVHF